MTGPGGPGASGPPPEPPSEPPPELRAFLGDDGRITVMPARRNRRLLLLDHLAQLFEPGQEYDETEVNRRLRDRHDDVAMLRRYLVDEGFLDRRDGRYWRVGGSVDV